MTKRTGPSDTRAPRKTLTALAVLAVIDVETRWRRDDLDAALESVRVIAHRRKRVLRRYLGHDYEVTRATIERDPGDAIVSALMRRFGPSGCSADLMAMADALRAIAAIDVELAEAMIRCHACWTQSNAYLDRCAEASRAAARKMD